jgi:ribosomal-protein-alanine N-acetyltransferase
MSSVSSLPQPQVRKAWHCDHHSRLRKGGPADLEEIYALNVVSFSEAWSRQSLANALDTGFDFRVRRIRGGQLAAYYLGQDVLDEVHVLQLAVAPPFRRQGLASEIMREMMAEKRLLGIRRAILEVRDSNRIAQQMYKALGFSVIGRRKDYYRSPNGTRKCEDALIMLRRL